MSQVSRNTVKTWFETGDRPTQAQFYDWLESVVWYDEPKIYAAIIGQSGTDAPTAVVAKNTFVGALTWSRTGAGMYRLTSANSEFAVGKTIITSANGIGAGKISTAYSADATRVDIVITNSAGTPSDSILISASFKVEVYA